MPSVPCRRLAKPGPKTQLMSGISWQWRMVHHPLLTPTSIVLKEGTVGISSTNRIFFHRSRPAQSSRLQSPTIGERVAGSEKSQCQCRQPPAGRPRHPTEIRKAGRRPPTKFEAGSWEKQRSGITYLHDSDYPTHLEPSHRFAAPLSNPPHGAGRQHCGCDVLPVSIGTAVDSPP